MKYVFSRTYFFWLRENKFFVNFHNWNWFSKMQSSEAYYKYL